MRATIKRLFCLTMALVLAASCLPTTIFAENAATVPAATASEASTVDNSVVIRNENTGATYEDIMDAIYDANPGEKLTLMQDTGVTDLSVYEDITLDLNGYSVEAKYANIYGNLVDNSAANSGRLVISPSRVMFRGSNKQLPVYTGDSFCFVDMKGFNTGMQTSNKFAFQPLFETYAHQFMTSSAAAAEVSVQVEMTWMKDGNLRSQSVIYNDEMIAKFIASARANGNGYNSILTLTIANMADFENLTFTAKVVSSAGVTLTSADPGNVQVDGNGNAAQSVTLEEGSNSAFVSKGTKLEANTKNLTLTTSELAQTSSNVTVSDGETLYALDVHVDGIAKDNTVPVIVTLDALAETSLNQGNLALYHVENGVTYAMTRVYSLSDLNAHNQYYYDIATGTITVAMATFSEITLLSENDKAWKGEFDFSWYDAEATSYSIYNADQLAAFGAIVGGMLEKEYDSFAGKTVKLMADINIGDTDSENGYVFYPIGYYNNEGTYEKTGTAISSGFRNFEGTFDGNGHTIANFYQNTWEMKGDNEYYDATQQRYRDGMGLFGRVYGGTIKNLTVKNFSSDGEYTTTGTIAAYADCGAIFENIAIFNCNPRVYNIGNGGIVGCVGWYNKTASTEENPVAPVTFRNITVDNTNKISALWGSWDVSCGGIVGQYYPTSGQSSANYPKNAGIYLENCHVAAQIDVYNDVCANYQYYAYRYAGILIGSVRENETVNGHVYPKMDGIAAKDCTVHFGDWNDYYYCELVANSLASYTHDHQMSRLQQVAAVDVENMQVTYLNGATADIPSGRVNYVVVKAKDNDTGMWIHGDGHDYATCYHFVDGQVWNHEDAGTEIVDGQTVLMEDKQLVYREFNNLITGYGWGVTSKGVEDMDGVEILDRKVGNSVVKFHKNIADNTQFISGTILNIGDLFKDANAEVAIVTENVQVSVSPADNDSTVSGDYAANTTDWTAGTLTFSGAGKATITITDYYFCISTTLEVEILPVAKIGETVYTSLQDALDAAQDGDTITLLTDFVVEEYVDVYTLNGGEIERSFILDLNGHTISSAEDYNYQWYPLVFVGVRQTVTIQNGTISAKEHVALGAYGTVNLENVNIIADPVTYAQGEAALCIWNWNKDDPYNKGYDYMVTGSSSISGGSVTGGILAEGTVCLAADAGFDKLYINNKTEHGKAILPDGYGLVKNVKDGYFHSLHKHEDNDYGACKTCGLAFSFVETDLADIKSTDIVVITMTATDGTVYALTNGNGTSKAPTAIIVSVDMITSNVDHTLQWNIYNNNGNLTIYPNGVTDKWLYCTNNNNGVRVGTNNDNKVFILDETSGYLQNIATERYVGVFTDNPDWRCYTTINTNIKDQTLTFYVLKSNCEHTNTENRPEIAATCTEAGHKAGVYCNDCDTYTEGGEVINATGHKFTVADVKAPTCTEDGLEVSYCDICHKKTTHKLNKAGHSYDDGVITTAATCNENGVKTYTCSGCSETKTETIPATGHQNTTTTSVDATCTAAGSVTVTCDDCGETVSTETIPATGVHTYVDGVCSGCGDKQILQQFTVTFQVNGKEASVKPVNAGETVAVPDAPKALEGYTFVGWTTKENAADDNNLFDFSTPINSDITLYALYSYAESSGTEGWNETAIAEIAADDVFVIVAKNSSGYYAMSNNNGTGSAPAAVAVTVSDGKITSKVADNIKWNIDGNAASGYIFYPNGDNTKWLYCTNSNNGVRVGTNANKVFTWDSSSYLKNTATSRFLGVYNSQDWRCYDSPTGVNIKGQSFTFYVYSSGANAPYYTTQMVCKHSNTEEQIVTAATCVAAGSKNIVCKDCDEIITANVEIPVIAHSYDQGVITKPATCTEAGVKTFTCSACHGTKTEAITVIDHNYEDGKCTACGAEDPNSGKVETIEAKLSFANKAQRTTFTTAKQVWEQNGITLTNDKSSSTNDVGDYAAPARFYAGSKITINAPGNITKIVFDCNSSNYATALKNSIGTISGATVSVSSDKVTIAFTSSVESFVIAKLTAQVRMDAITVTYEDK